MDVLHGIALAILARAAELDGLSRVGSQRDASGLVAAGEGDIERLHRIEPWVDQEDLIGKS